jgi:hypothetical protein
MIRAKKLNGLQAEVRRMMRPRSRAFLETTDPPFCGTSNVWRSAAEEDAVTALLFER